MSDDRSLSGKRALVCGASSGIGRATAMALAARGADVVALARRREELEALVPELIGAGAKSADFVVADVEDADALAAAVEDAGLVHILVNNSGGPKPGRLLDSDAEDLLVGFRRPLGPGDLTTLLFIGAVDLQVLPSRPPGNMTSISAG